MLCFLKKAGKIAAALASGGWSPTQLLLSFNLRVTFEHCSDFSVSVHLRSIISYLSEGWAPLAKLAFLAQISSYATAFLYTLNSEVFT